HQRDRRPAECALELPARAEGRERSGSRIRRDLREEDGQENVLPAAAREEQEEDEARDRKGPSRELDTQQGTEDVQPSFRQFAPASRREQREIEIAAGFRRRGKSSQRGMQNHRQQETEPGDQAGGLPPDGPASEARQAEQSDEERSLLLERRTEVRSDQE